MTLRTSETHTGNQKRLYFDACPFCDAPLGKGPGENRSTAVHIREHCEVVEEVYR